MSDERFFDGGYATRSFLAFQECVVPRTQDFTDREIDESFRIINRRLAANNRRRRLHVLAFLLLLDACALLIRGRRLAGLEPSARQPVLELFHSSGSARLRRGFAALKTLARLGVYGQESIYPAIRFRQFRPFGQNRPLGIKRVPDDRKVS